MTRHYMTGFGNSFETEALSGALPVGRNSPQNCAYGLYAEQLSGTAFTAPRASNQRTWAYRIRPSVAHISDFVRHDVPYWLSAPARTTSELPVQPLRWSALDNPGTDHTFISGMRTMTTAGDVRVQSGMSASVYLVTQSMHDEFFYNADAEMLIVLQSGNLEVHTELGIIDASPGEIIVIPRGMKISVKLGKTLDDPALEKFARGYVCENYGPAFSLPERGPIGANCLANPRDFQSPIAAFEDSDRHCTLTVKWGGHFYQCELDHSPLDVVAWHGNYAPYKYDLRRFSPVGAIGFDHPDPSIFTVLTAMSESPGTANVDFVIFPERWLVAENTFRPPWYHMNVMSEFMGNIQGEYDAKPDGFPPGAMSLHNCMLPHGPDSDAFERATASELQPQKLTDTLAFMFETRFPQNITEFAATTDKRQSEYRNCWKGLKKRFDGTPNPA